MAQTRTFRVFVSSTFRDLEEERNYLRERVYPDLRALCANHQARFQAIDLRWGVSREASLDQQAMNVCLEEIDRCREVTPRPNFVVLLGNRHGWLAPPPQIPAKEFDKLLKHVPKAEDKSLLTGSEGWYRPDDNADPSEYYLRPREGEHEKDTAWEPVEARLHAILADAAKAADCEHNPKYTASATEQEILHGALGIGALEGRAFCFVRELSGEHPDPATANKNDPILDFVDPDQTPLKKLKGVLHAELGYTKYEARWDPRTERPTTDHLEDLARDVREALTAAILEEIEHPSPVSGPARTSERVAADQALDGEGRAHRAFAEDRCRIFVGREDELATIAAYLRGNDTRPFVVAGAGGTGKSALLAEALRRAQHDHESANVVHRFIGATPASSDARALLQGLCQELARRAGTEDSAVPGDYQELVSDLRERLQSMGGAGPLLVFLDSLDQLSPNHGARGLAWLPVLLPAGVRLVVSTRPEDTLAPLQKRGAPITELGPMTADDGAEMLGRWLKEHHRALQPAQSKEVLANFAASDGNPLYLRLAFHEARRWRSDEQPEDREHLATGVQGIIAENTYGRLAKKENHGDVLVSHALGYLAASRYGLAEDELLDLLSRDTEVYEWFLRSAHDVPPDLRERADEYRKPTTDAELTRWLDAIRTGTQEKEQSELRAFLDQVLPRKNGPQLPVVLWSRLFFDLRPYLTEREAEGAKLITFFHRELGDIARREFLGRRAPDYHAKLADYFTPAVGDDGRPNWAEASLRGLSELPYHLVEAHRWDDVEETLTDFDFLEAKMSRVAVDRRADQHGNEVVAHTGVRRLQDDFDLALQAISGGEGADPHPIIVTATDLGDGFVVRCPHCNVIHVLEGMCAHCKASHDLAHWLSNEITCPNVRCQAALKVNEFTAGGAGPRPRAAPASRALSAAPSSGVNGAETATSRGRSQELLEAFAVALGREQHVLRSQPWLCFQQLYNRLQWDTEPVAAVLQHARTRREAGAGSPPWVWTRWAFREAGSLRRTLAGHTDSVKGCAVSPDGRLVVSASQDHTLKVWDPETGTVTATLTGHTGSVHGCAFSPDGRRVVSASYDDTLKVWDLETTTVTATFTRRGAGTGCAFSPDGRHVVAASENDTLKVWDLETGTVTATLIGHHSRVSGCAFSPDGRQVVSAGGKWELKVWDLETSTETATLYGHAGHVDGCAFSPDGRWVLSASSDDTLKVWDLETGAEVATLTGHTGWVTACAVSPDGRLVVSASHDHTLKVWDPETGTETATLYGHAGHVDGCAFSPDGRWVLSASEDHTLKVWDLDAGAATATRTGHGGWVRACAFSPDGRRVVSASWDQTLKVWDVETGAEVTTFTGHTEQVTGCVVSPDGHRVASFGEFERVAEESVLRVWDLETGVGTAILPLAGFDDGVSRCAFSPDGGHVVASSEKGIQKVWDLATGEVVPDLACPVSPGRGGWALSPDRDRVVVSNRNVDWYSALKVWGLETATFTSRGGGVGQGCAVSPDGRRIVFALNDQTSPPWSPARGGRTLKVWDLATDTETATLAGHTEAVNECAISPDGRWAASAGRDNTLRVWELETGTEAATLPLTGRVESVAFHPERPLIACGDAGGSVMVAELIRIDYGPLAVTAIDQGAGRVLRCPACQGAHPLEDAWLDQVIDCPAGCGARLHVNPFVARAWRRHREPRINPSLPAPDPPPPNSPWRGLRALLRHRPKR